MAILDQYHRQFQQRCKICSKLTIKRPERRQWNRTYFTLFSIVSTIDFEQANVSCVFNDEQVFSEYITSFYRKLFLVESSGLKLEKVSSQKSWKFVIALTTTSLTILYKISKVILISQMMNLDMKSSPMIQNVYYWALVSSQWPCSLKVVGPYP